MGQRKKLSERLKEAQQFSEEERRKYQEEKKRKEEEERQKKESEENRKRWELERKEREKKKTEKEREKREKEREERERQQRIRADERFNKKVGWFIFGFISLVLLIGGCSSLLKAMGSNPSWGGYLLVAIIVITFFLGA